MKTCTKCLQTKPFDDFYRHPKGKDGFRPWCKDCHNSSNKEWRDNNVERQRGYWRKAARDSKWRKWGLTNEEALALFNSQGGKCASCGIEITLGTDEKRGTADLDHNHKHCGKKHGCRACIRGFLCRKCNLIAAAIESDNFKLVLHYLEHR